jgi:hypothetical protein
MAYTPTPEVIKPTANITMMSAPTVFMVLSFPDNAMVDELLSSEDGSLGGGRLLCPFKESQTARIQFSSCCADSSPISPSVSPHAKEGLVVQIVCASG